MLTIVACSSSDGGEPATQTSIPADSTSSGATTSPASAGANASPSAAAMSGAAAGAFGNASDVPGGSGGARSNGPAAGSGAGEGQSEDGDQDAGSAGASAGSRAPVAGSAGVPAAESGDTCDKSASPGVAVPVIYVVGDSTASIYEKDLYPRTGWAQVLSDYFASACALVKDAALSGRSSKSFYDEGSWTPVRSQLRAGDFVLIQFGHNDEKSDDPARYTAPDTTYKQYLSKYIDDSQAKGATPILLTPIQRNSWSGGMVKDTHGAYPAAVRQLAKDRSVSLVDMTVLTDAYFEKLGQAMTTALFMNLAAGESPNYPNGNEDNTHLQEKGARAVCQLAVADMVARKLPPAVLLKMRVTPP